MNEEREVSLIQGCMEGLELFRVATDEQAREIKQEYFGTDNDFALLDIFKKLLDRLPDDAREIVWNTILVELGLQDLDMTMEQMIDFARAKMTYDSVPILNWGSNTTLPRVARTEEGLCRAVYSQQQQN